MTDPTITIAGLRARINSLLSAVQHSNRTTAERVTMFVEASSNADRLTAERDALAAQLAEVRAELVQLGGADLARDAAEDRAARLDAELAKVRAELAAAPKVCAIHSYALEGPCMTCGAPWPGAEKALRQERVEGMEKMRRISAAVGCPNSVEEVVEAVAAIKSDLASERARLAAYKERIAGLEQAADQRTRSLDAALTAERETSRGLVAQVDTWRDTWARVETIVDEAFGPFPVWPVYDTICAMERGIHDGIRAAQELAAIRDLVAPGNPQGTVVNAVRTTMHALGLVREDRDRASALAANRTAACDRADAEIAKLRAELAELRARPVLTVEAFTEAYIKTKHGGKAWPGEEADRRGLTAQFRATFAALGPVALPSPDRAEELLRSFDAGVESLDVSNLTDDEFEQGRLASMRAALAKLSPAPAPTFDAARLAAGVPVTPERK